MDGFFQDMDYGKGLLDHSSPLSKSNVGKSGLPGSLTANEWVLDRDLLGDPGEPKIESDQFDLGFECSPELSNVVASRSGQKIIDHSWLDNAFQDPGRLPTLQTDQLPALEQLWGGRTDGIRRIPLRDREEVLNKNLSVPADQDIFNVDKISRMQTNQKLIRSAMRKSASHMPLSEIAQDLYSKAPTELEQLRPSFKAIQAEHGLVGNVYIRASAYPNFERGKWNKEIQRVGKTARYLVSEQDTPQIREAASLLGLHLVKSANDIPWESEVQYYLPILKAAGKEIDTRLPPSEMLRKAFLSPSKVWRKTTDSLKPQEVVKSNLTAKQAQQLLQEWKPPKREIKSIFAQLQDKADLQASKKIESWVKAGYLNGQEKSQILNSGVRPYIALPKIASLIGSRQLKSGQYQGEGVSYMNTGIGSFLRQASGSQWQKQVQEKIEQSARRAALERRSKVTTQLRKMVIAKLISPDQMQQLLVSGMDSSQIEKAAELLAVQAKKGSYSGYQNHAVAKTPVSEGQVRASLKEMSERMLDTNRKLAQKKEEDEIRKKANLVENAIKSGVRGERLATLIQNTLTPEEGERVKHRINPLLLKYNALGTKTASTPMYQGSIYTEFNGKVSQPNIEVTPKMVNHAVKVAAQRMNQGLVGPKLDHALSQDLDPAVLVAAQQPLVQIRKKHEGLAGFAYIDPSVYASKKGYKGCDEGSFIHKNASVPYVLAMPKCLTCPHKDLQNRCKKYNRRVVSEVPHDDPQALKEANIKKASMSEINEDTFFANNGGFVDEFGVVEEPLIIELNEKKSEPSNLDFTFGGVIL